MRTLVNRLAVVAAVLGSGLVGLASCQAQPVELGWQPARTWVFVAGLLQWKDSASFASFPQKDRRDALLVDALRRAGVPQDHVLYLQDKAATTQALEEDLPQFLSRSRPGDLLVLYYCGHGYKEDGGTAYFASYDAAGSTKGWPMASIPAAIEQRFHGSRAILAADCCDSGSLARAVKSTRGPVSIACLSSSSANEESTGNWTFTEALLDGFGGKPWVDLDGDGAITLGELARHVTEDMARVEHQLASFTTTGNFSPDTVLAVSSGRDGGRIGQLVQAKSQGDWYDARIVAARPGEVKVHYFGYDYDDDEWVNAADTRPLPTPTTYPVGAHVQVKWNGKWYPATVLQSKDGVHFIHYTDYDDSWDEWVPPSRIKAE